MCRFRKGVRRAGGFIKKVAKKYFKFALKITGIDKVADWIFEGLVDIPDIDIDRGVLINKSGGDLQIPIVYGTRRIGGIRAFVRVSGATNEFLHLAIILC